jgi:hypothetical protein
VLDYEPGSIREHWMRFANLAAEGAYVQITSDCLSACTLVMTHLSTQQLCFTTNARLGFH